MICCFTGVCYRTLTSTQAAFEDPDADRKRRIEQRNNAVLILGKDQVEKITASRLDRAVGRLRAEKAGEEV